LPSESEVITWRCRQCRELKKEGNRWWIVRIGPAAGFSRVLSLRPFEPPLAEDEFALCGHTCAAAELNDYFAKIREGVEP